MKPDVILAVDQSTSATKALLFDDGGRIIRRVSVPHEQHYPRPGWVEHDAKEILRNTTTALTEVVRSASLDPACIAALAVTNQRETVVAWDDRTGEPVSHALVWQDERGTEYCERMKREGAAGTVRSKTGLVIDTFFSASKLTWLVQNNSAARAALGAGHLLAGTMDAWLIWNLTRGKVFATDYSNACRTMLFSIGQLAWDSELLELFGLSGLRLPEVRYSDSTFGKWHSDELGVNLPIVGVMGDSHAALFGQAGFQPGNAKTTYGTGSSVMMNTGDQPIDPPEGVVASLGWGFDGSVAYVLEGNIHSTGDTVRWVRDNLGLFKDYGEAERRAAALDGNDGVYLVPAFNGLGAPHWRHGIRALISGINRGSTADHIIRSSMESIAYQVLDVVECMTSTGRVSLADLRVDGGPTSNRFLMQFQADILAAPIHVAAVEEVSARGVAFMAGLRTGVWGSLAELSELAQPKESFKPRMASEKRAGLIAGWQAALAQATAATISQKEA